jgi:hypothetical protein
MNNFIIGVQLLNKKLKRLAKLLLTYGGHVGATEEIAVAADG